MVLSLEGTFTGNTFLPPANIEAEEAILGGILFDPEAIKRIAESLLPQHFSLVSHQKIYKAVLNLYQKEQPTDLLAVIASLDENDLERMGGQGKLVQLLERTVTAVNIDHYANLVLEHSKRRELGKVANKIIDLAYDKNQDIDSVILGIRNEILEATEIKRWQPTQKLAKKKLDIKKILHPKLATPLSLLAKHFPFPEEICIHNLLPIVASLMKSNSSVCVRKTTNHHEKFILRSVIVAEASNRKSAIENIFTEPLQRLQEEQTELHATALATYEQEVQEWEKLSLEEQRKNPDKRPGNRPNQRHYIYTGGSKEGVWEILSNQPEQGILHAPDEILQVVSSRGEYSRGKSSDQDYSLSGFNGRKNTIIRKGKIVSFKDSSSLLGGIQPGKVLALNGNDVDDSRGELSRYLPLFFDIQPFYIPEDDLEIDTSQLLAWVYRKVDAIPQQVYRFDRQAQKAFVRWQRQCEHFRINLGSPSLRAFVGKLQGNTVKIAALLHILWNICEEKPISNEIGLQHLKAATDIANFYYLQACRLREASGETLNPINAAIIEKLKLEGKVTAGKLQSWNRLCRKKSCSEIYQRFEELALNHRDIMELDTNSRGNLELRLKISTKEFASVVSVEAENLMEDGFPTLTRLSANVSDETTSLATDSIEENQVCLESFVTIADTPDSAGNSHPEPIPDTSLTTDSIEKAKSTQSEPPHSEDDIANMTAALREALPENDWELIASLMLVDEPLKRAVWIRLSKEEQEQISALKTASTEPPPEPEPEPTPEPPPAPESKERRVKIPRDAKFEKGQSIVSADGEIVGKVLIVKNAHSADVRFFKKGRIQRIKKSDLDIYSYSREWVLGKEWFETFTLKGLDGGYEAKFWNMDKSQWMLTLRKDGLIAHQFPLREPEIYLYDSPEQWAWTRINIFLKKE